MPQYSMVIFMAGTSGQPASWMAGLGTQGGAGGWSGNTKPGNYNNYCLHCWHSVYSEFLITNPGTDPNYGHSRHH
jgi:hypothetical protein